MIDGRITFRVSLVALSFAACVAGAAQAATAPPAAVASAAPLATAVPSVAPVGTPAPAAAASPQPFDARRTTGAPLRSGTSPGSTSKFAEIRTVVDPVVFSALSVKDAEDAALAGSPDIAGARARLQESEYALAAARANLAPSFFSNYVQVPQGNPPTPNVISRQVTAGLQLAIGDFVAYSPALREAAFTLSSSQADYAAAVALERVKVIGLYYDALRARAVSTARQDALTIARSQLRAAQVRAQNGDAPQLDVVRAEVAAAKATADLETATADASNSLEGLSIEIGTPVDTLANTTTTDFPHVEARLTDVATVVALARAMRPELRSARLAAEAARAAVRSARALNFPSLVVNGGYLVGSDSDVPIHAPTIGAQLTIPLGAAGGLRVRAAEARAVEAQTRTLIAERQILLDVSASARTLGASDRAAVATTRARQAAETELRATQVGYRNGASSSIEVTFARLSFSQAVVDELTALYNLEKARATLDAEVGR